MADSPRWCARCNRYGDHHTDRCPEQPPGEWTVRVCDAEGCERADSQQAQCPAAGCPRRREPGTWSTVVPVVPKGSEYGRADARELVMRVAAAVQTRFAGDQSPRGEPASIVGDWIMEHAEHFAARASRSEEGDTRDK